jgi:hypothetical protein
LATINDEKSEFGNHPNNFVRGWGLAKLSPEKIATNLFGHLQPGDKIAITG